VADWVLNARGYLDVTFSDGAGSAPDAATILDSAPEVALSGAGAAGVTLNGVPTLVDGTTSTYRYTFTGTFTDGPVDVNFLVASFADNVGNLNQASVQSFDVQLQPSFWIDTPQPVLEGNEAQRMLNFTVRLTGWPAGMTGPVSVRYATASGTALAGRNYLPMRGTLTFRPDQALTKTLRVPVLVDRRYDNPETFLVNLSLPTGTTAGVPIAVGTATGTIIEGDPQPTLSIRDASVREGTSGTTTASFTVTLSAPSRLPTAVSYATTDGTATLADSDYQAASGTLTFAPGVTRQKIMVFVNGDTKYESSETFRVQLSGPTNATVARPAATGTIRNDDSRPTLSIADVTVNEGDAAAVFTLALAGTSQVPITVQYATGDRSALAGKDYTATSGTLSLDPTTYNPASPVQISVPVLDDALAEAKETFQLRLFSASGARIVRSTAICSIVDNDSPPASLLDSLAADHRRFRTPLGAKEADLVDEAFRLPTV
jgi:hypothetical protein